MDSLENSGENINLTSNSEYDGYTQRLTSRFVFSLMTIPTVIPLIVLIYSTHSDTIKNSDGKHEVEGEIGR
jgi:hypothetical protein